MVSEYGAPATDPHPETPCTGDVEEDDKLNSEAAVACAEKTTEEDCVDGCSWDKDENKCAEAAAACADKTTEDTCTDGCSWEGGKCQEAAVDCASKQTEDTCTGG